MPTIEEMSAWTLDELKVEIHQALPPGWSFNYGWNEDVDGWATIHDETGKTAWETAGVWDETLLLFNAYGWLTTRNVEPKNPVWARRRGVVPKPVVGQYSLPGVSVPDPEDLDPAEIASVYFDPTKRR
jgi:hypothetical protein